MSFQVTILSLTDGISFLGDFETLGLSCLLPFGRLSVFLVALLRLSILFVDLEETDLFFKTEVLFFKPGVLFFFRVEVFPLMILRRLVVEAVSYSKSTSFETSK